jgi:hypothetical protein
VFYHTSMGMLMAGPSEDKTLLLPLASAAAHRQVRKPTSWATPVALGLKCCPLPTLPSPVPLVNPFPPLRARTHKHESSHPLGPTAPATGATAPS